MLGLPCTCSMCHAWFQPHLCCPVLLALLLCAAAPRDVFAPSQPQGQYKFKALVVQLQVRQLRYRQQCLYAVQLYCHMSFQTVGFCSLELNNLRLASLLDGGQAPPLTAAGQQLGTPLTLLSLLPSQSGPVVVGLWQGPRHQPREA